MTSAFLSRESLIDWRASEAICRELAANASEWTASFFVPDTKTFRVAYVNGEIFRARIDPNATTSSVVIIDKDIEALALSPGELASTRRLRSNVSSCLEALTEWKPHVILPLRSFGVLPLFSVSYLAHALGHAPKALTCPAYAVAIRRVLFQLHLAQTQHWGHLQKTDQLHPFVLFHCTRALLRLRTVLAEAHAAGKTAELTVFAANLEDDSLVLRVVEQAGYDSQMAASSAAALCGTGAASGEFKTQYLSALVGGPTGGGLDRAFLFIEGLAFSQAIAELAKPATQQHHAPDPGALGFSLNVLSELNGHRHTLLLGQGVDALIGLCERGRYAPGRPFHIDSQGRALAVPSVEVATALLAVALRRVRSAPDSEVLAVVNATRAIEAVMAEDVRRVEVALDPFGAGIRDGWCSDRAPSDYRVDAWVTAHAALFFLQRLRLLGAAKRRHVLGRYNWTPHARCKPKWDDIEEPNAGVAPSLKDLLSSVVQLPPSGKRARAPVFLLYGPPGSSKTSFVQGIASNLGWDLITLSPSDFIADSLDRIEFRSREVFEDLRNIDECVILLDEMDSLLRDRETIAEKNPGSIMEFVVPALLPKLQDLRDYSLDKRMAVFFATNYYETIDSAILRSGRIDSHVPVLPYSREARTRVLERMLGAVHPTIGDAIRKALVAYVHTLPCSLVYRDLERLVEAVDGIADPAAVASRVQLIARSIGVSPDVYSPKRRPKAFGEFCAMLARVNNEAPPAVDVAVSKDAARSYLQGALARMPTGQAWRVLAEEWVYLLK
jgi:hypothetical protein